MNCKFFATFRVAAADSYPISRKAREPGTSGLPLGSRLTHAREAAQLNNSFG